MQYNIKTIYFVIHQHQMTFVIYLPNIGTTFILKLPLQIEFKYK